MASKILARSNFRSLTSTRSLSASSSSSVSAFNNQSPYRKRISLANLLQRYGFPPSQLQNFLSRNHYLLNSDLSQIEKSLGILLSLKIPQRSLVSLISDCPGVLQVDFLRKWEVDFPKFRKLGMPSSVIGSVLQQSKKFQIDSNWFSETLIILKSLGFSDKTISRILGEFPKVTMMKETEIRRKIEFLELLGTTKDDIDRFLSVFPEILGHSIENRLRPLLEEFKNIGLSRDDIRREIYKEPRILGLELGELSRCLEFLRTLKCRLSIKERIFEDGAFSAGFEVKLRVDCLCKHGLTRRDSFKVLWKEPRVILYKIEDIEKKIEFLTNTMRFNICCLAEVPEYLGVNLEKQIVPRYNVIEYLRQKGGLGMDVGLRCMIKPSTKRFYNFYVKPYPECEKLFGRSRVKAQVRHPPGLWKMFKPISYEETKEDVKNMKSFVESLV